MESSVAASINEQSWIIVPSNTLAGILLTVLFLYLMFRHFVFILMIFDLIIGWLKGFNWFPGKGKRLKTFIHWLIALMLFIGFLILAGMFGWLEFVPQ